MAFGNLFNEEWYLKNYPDVRAAVEAGIIDAHTHFELHGRFEGRSPDPLFNPAEYLAANPDVRAAVEAGTLTAYDHFVQFGATEGRSPTKLFDPAFYLSQNPDVRAAVEAGLISATEHFLLYGQGEPRQVNPFINLGDYLEANPDLKQAAEAGLLSPLTHLLIHGAAEDRDLGNGINLGIFADDPAYKAAIQSGDFTAAMGRVGEVAPFLPSFEPPAGWEPAPNTPIPTDFTPPEGTKLVIPPSVEVPDDVELPDTFEPGEPGEPGPDPEPPTFTVTVSGSVLTVEGTATDAVVVDLSANTVTRAGNPVTVKDSPNLTGVIATNYSGNVTALNAAVDATLTDVDAYTLLDTLENLTAADAAVLEGATSYTLSDTAAALTEAGDGSTLIELAHGAEKLIVTEGNLNLRNDKSVEGTLIVELAGDEGQEFIIPDNEDLFVNVTGSDANDVIRGHDSSAPSQTFIADGGAGSDVLRGGTGLSELSGGDGYDTVFAMFSVAGGGSNLLFAGHRTEMDDQGVYAEGANAVSDSDANTYARGFFNPNLRNEVNEANVLQGGAANDIMVASEVKDIFYYQLGREHGQDTIHQFTIGEDHISVVGRLVKINPKNPGAIYQDIVFTSAGESDEDFVFGTSNSVPNYINAEAAGWKYDAENSLLTLSADDLIAYIEKTQGEGALPVDYEYGNFNDISIELVGIQGGEVLTVSDFFSDYSSVI